MSFRLRAELEIDDVSSVTQEQIEEIARRLALRLNAQTSVSRFSAEGGDEDKISSAIEIDLTGTFIQSMVDDLEAKKRWNSNYYEVLDATELVRDNVRYEISSLAADLDVWLQVTYVVNAV